MQRASQAAVNCNVSARNLGELYDSAGNSSVQSNIIINCSRTLPTDPSTVYYSIKANYGLNSSGGVTRNVKHTASSATLLWVLRNSVGPLGCGNTTNWGDSAGVGLIEGALSFSGAALTTSATLSNAYCMRVRGMSGGNPEFPAAGTYVDTVTITPDMSTTAVSVAPYNVSAPSTQMSFTVGVTPVCVIRKQGQDLSFNYTSFTSTALEQVSQFKAICSNGLDYQVTVSPGTGTIAGINYTVNRVGGQIARAIVQNKMRMSE